MVVAGAGRGRASGRRVQGQLPHLPARLHRSRLRHAARRARELWHELEDESGRQLLCPAPQLTFGPQLAAVHEAMRRAGAPGELLPADGAARFPGCGVGGPALLETESCVIAADATLQRAGRRGRAAGPRRAGHRTGRRRPPGDAASGQAGPVTAGTRSCAPGPWTAGLLAAAGHPVPSAPTLEQVAYLAPADPVPRPPPAGHADLHLPRRPESPYGLPVPGSPPVQDRHPPERAGRRPGRQDHAADPELAGRLGRRRAPGTCPASTAGAGARPSGASTTTRPDDDFILDRLGRS